jgi:small subunit ribosomal protein S1
MNTKSDSPDVNPEETAAVEPKEAPTESDTEKLEPPAEEAATEVETVTEAPEAEVSAAPSEAEASDAPAEEPKAGSEAVETESEEVKAEETSVETEAAEVTMAEPTEDAAREVAAAVEADSRLEHKLKKGERVEVKLVQVSDKDAFLDWGGPSEGSIAAAELKNEEGELRVKEGESFTAIVREVGDTMVFTVGRGKGGDLLRMRELQSAHEGKIPVPGKIRSTNKGGFEVDLGGVRAFCPFSQIDTIYCEKPEEHLAKEYSFEIITFERGGRNIVVSRRGIIEAEQKEQAKSTRESLEIGAVMTGKIRRIQPYGAFVDIGGLDGLVHVSEISQAHVRNPKDVLSVGQEVEVKIVAIDGLGTKKERVSLSMKSLAPNPWDGAAEKWKVGTTVKGRVVRLTDFGAFVELAPGVDGLVHISQIAPERIGHPSEVLAPNQEVDVRVLDLDSDAHRISLTMRPEGEEGERGGGGGFRGGRRPPRERTPMEYSSGAEEKDEKVDVSGMEYDDALAALKKKFER